MPRINQRQLVIEINASEKLLVREATQVIQKQYFEPAVKELQSEFANHPVSQEIEGGITASNLSNTLIGGSSTEGKNLYSFIGFEDGDSPLSPIYERLDPTSPDGPQVKYLKGSNKNNLLFRFAIIGPNLSSIFSKTPMPWAPGLSWAQRIEQGIPGFNKFKNGFKAGSSRSGGGIQVEANLRPGARYKATSYLSGLVRSFLSKFNKQ